jgi:hypothetical protein
MGTILLLMAGVALLLYSIREEHLLGQVAAPILTLGAVHGLWRGGFRKILMLLVTVGVLYFVCAYPTFADPLVQRVVGASSGVVSGLITVGVAIIMYLVANRAVARFRGRHIANRTGRLRLDRLVGTTIGFAEGAIVVLSICWTAVMVRPNALAARDRVDSSVDPSQRQTAAAVVKLADEAEAEPFGQIVNATNLIERMPALHDTIDQFNRTGTIELSHLNPEATRKLDDLTKQVFQGQYQNFDDLLRAAQQGRQGQQPPQQRTPVLGNHRR